MRRPVLIEILLLVLSLLLLLTMVNYFSVEQVRVPFTTPTGYSGLIDFSYPSGIFAGDKGNILLQISLEDEPSQTPAELTVHVEAGFEELSPSGPVVVRIQHAKDVKLDWSIRTALTADYPGTLWIWLNTGEGQVLVMAKDIRVTSVYLLGIRIIYFRIALGIVFVVLCAWYLYWFLKKKLQ